MPFSCSEKRPYENSICAASVTTSIFRSTSRRQSSSEIVGFSTVSRITAQATLATTTGLCRTSHKSTDNVSALSFTPLLKSRPVPKKRRARLAHAFPVAASGGLSRSVRRFRIRAQRKFRGQNIDRHICATGELSKPKPSFGWRKWRPTMSVKISRSTFALGSKE